MRKLIVALFAFGLAGAVQASTVCTVIQQQQCSSYCGEEAWDARCNAWEEQACWDIPGTNIIHCGTRKYVSCLCIYQGGGGGDPQQHTLAEGASGNVFGQGGSTAVTILPNGGGYTAQWTPDYVPEDDGPQ